MNSESQLEALRKTTEAFVGPFAGVLTNKHVERQDDSHRHLLSQLATDRRNFREFVSYTDNVDVVVGSAIGSPVVDQQAEAPKAYFRPEDFGLVL